MHFTSLFGLIVIATMKEQLVLLLEPRISACIKLLIVANVKAAATRDPEEIRRLLVEQVTGRVRWRESVTWMAEQGVTEFVEVGAGKSLSGMVKLIVKGLETRAVGTPADVQALATAG